MPAGDGGVGHFRHRRATSGGSGLAPLSLNGPPLLPPSRSTTTTPRLTATFDGLVLPPPPEEPDSDSSVGHRRSFSTSGGSTTPFATEDLVVVTPRLRQDSDGGGPISGPKLANGHAHVVSPWGSDGGGVLVDAGSVVSVVSPAPVNRAMLWWQHVLRFCRSAASWLIMPAVLLLLAKVMSNQNTFGTVSQLSVPTQIDFSAMIYGDLRLPFLYNECVTAATAVCACVCVGSPCTHGIGVRGTAVFQEPEQHRGYGHRVEHGLQPCGCESIHTVCRRWRRRVPGERFRYVRCCACLSQATRDRTIPEVYCLLSPPSITDGMSNLLRMSCMLLNTTSSPAYSKRPFR